MTTTSISIIIILQNFWWYLVRVSTIIFWVESYYFFLFSYCLFFYLVIASWRNLGWWLSWYLCWRLVLIFIWRWNIIIIIICRRLFFYILIRFFICINDRFVLSYIIFNIIILILIFPFNTIATSCSCPLFIASSPIISSDFIFTTHSTIISIFIILSIISNIRPYLIFIIIPIIVIIIINRIIIFILRFILVFIFCSNITNLMFRLVSV